MNIDRILYSTVIDVLKMGGGARRPSLSLDCGLLRWGDRVSGGWTPFYLNCD
jgi:hypothetical protein